MAPYDLVRSKNTFPFELYPFQVEDTNILAPRPRSGYYAECGLGKTATSTHCSIYKLEQGHVNMVVMIVPPILIPQWGKWLRSIKRSDGSTFNVVEYAGTPAQRKAMNLDVDFIIVSIQIFKRDIERLERECRRKSVHVCVDEAQMIKNVGSGNYKMVRDFAMDKSLQLLTGTPLNSPEDAYAYVKLIAPEIYRSYKAFMQTHVLEQDFFGNVTKWQNLDLLQRNLLFQSIRRTKEEVLKDLPECTIVPIEYDLDPAHLKLYRKMVDEQLLKIGEDEKIDLTTSSALFHALGQVVMGWAHFAGDETKNPEGFSLLDEVRSEIGKDKKLLVFANYKRTNTDIIKRYACPAIYGEVSPAAKQTNLAKFIEDPQCTLMVMQPSSGGVGVDGCQHVSSDALYLEPPVSVSQFTQSLSRVHRSGQKLPVTVRIAIARGTVQEHQAKRLAAREDLVNTIQLSKVMLRDALLGGH